MYINVNGQQVRFILDISGNKLIIAAYIGQARYNILGMNSFGEVWRYAGLPPNNIFKLNKEGKILECK